VQRRYGVTNKETVAEEKAHRDGDSMGKEMMRNEEQLRGLYRGAISRRCTPGMEDWLLWSCVQSFALSLGCQPVKYKMSLTFLRFNSVDCPSRRSGIN